MISLEETLENIEFKRRHDIEKRDIHNKVDELVNKIISRSETRT